MLLSLMNYNKIIKTTPTALCVYSNSINGSGVKVENATKIVHFCRFELVWEPRKREYEQ